MPARQPDAEKKIMIAIRFPAGLKDRVQETARRENRTMAAMIVELCERGMSRTRAAEQVASAP